MAYTDIIHTEYNLLQTAGSTINFAFDSPVSNDGSPHMTHLNFQFDITMSGAVTSLNCGGDGLVADLRIKVGSQELINFQQTLYDTGFTNRTITGAGVLAQKVGGYTNVDNDAGTVGHFVANFCLPYGLDASVPHRFNVTLSTTDASDFCGSAAETISSSELNMIAHYGVSKETVLYGSRQDFNITADAARNFVIYGKAGWNMLGVLQTGNYTTLGDQVDDFSSIRLKNGAFRSLTMFDWRTVNGDMWNSPLRYPATTLNDTTPQYKGEQLGVVFLDLRRLTAGANAELLGTAAVTASATSFFPIWVAPIGTSLPQPPKQTVTTVDSTTEEVVGQSAYGTNA
jgi:hypothetical protein